MFNLILRFLKWLLPIVQTAAVQVIHEETRKWIYKHERPRGLSDLVEYATKDVKASASLFSTGPAEGPSVHRISKPRPAPNTPVDDEFFRNAEHDVIVVAFDVFGMNKKEIYKFLSVNMPVAAYYPSSDIVLDAWWIADDDDALTDCDSAVFVTKGNQYAARELLKAHGLVE